MEGRKPASPKALWFLVVFLFFQHLARGHLPARQPVFRSPPVTVKAEENDTIFLPCAVDDPGESAIRWWKKETLISDSSSPMVAVPPKYTVMRDGMTIEGLEADDAGDYICELVRPKPWSSLKQTHRVQVLYPPKVFPNPSDGYLEVQLGGRVVMGCTATGVPTPFISWKTNKVALKVIKDSRPTLEFTATDRLMSGLYQCEAFNGVGHSVFANIFLRILYKPEVKVDKEWVHSAPGIKTALVCRVAADPEAHVEWLFNDRKLTVAGPRLAYFVGGSDHFLKFNTVLGSDFGNYTCRAKNVLGSSQGFIQLSGVANPAVIKRAEGISSTEFHLIWEVDSYSPIFEYKLDFRKQIKDAPWSSFIIPADSFSSGPLHSKSYTFSGLDKFAVYEAKILSRNRFGWSNSSEIVSFGFLKPKYTEASESPNEVYSASTSSASLVLTPSLVTAPIVFILTLKLFLCTCGTS